MTTPIRIRGRLSTYGVLAGVVVSIMVLGLAVPLIMGRPAPSDTDVAASSDGSPSGDGVGAGPAAERGAASGPTSDPVTTSPGMAGTGSPEDDAERGVGADAVVSPVGGGSGGRSAPLAASDTGVTASEIRVGFLLLDLGSASRLGFNFPGVDPETQQTMYEAYVEDINARGGINGRKITAFYRAYDVTSGDDMRRVCIDLTQDLKVFAVVGQFVQSQPVLCLTEENGTPNVAPMTQGLPEFLIDRSHALLF